MSRLSSYSYGAAATAFFVVLVPCKILIHEDEKNQIRSHAYAQRLFLFSAFPPGRRPRWARGRIPDTCTP